jgi:hypothetical protein
MAIVDTTVVNMRTNPHDVAIDRSSPFGNPYHRDQTNDRNAVLALYRTYFYKRVEQDAEFKRRVLDLRGKRLGCWCTGPCHGMIIVEYIENYYAARDAVKPMDFTLHTTKVTS